jgi:hypothetical protein
MYICLRDVYKSIYWSRWGGEGRIGFSKSDGERGAVLGIITYIYLLDGMGWAC